MDYQKEAQKIVDAAVAEGSENSVQFSVYHNGECIVDVFAGWIDFARTRPIDRHTIFPVYSTSKGVPAAALTRLIGQGRLSLETPVAEIWPEFAKNGKERTLIRHFLEHTSGLPQRFPEQSSYELIVDWKHMIRTIENCAPDWEPGTQTRYQSLTYGWVTAEIIQRITGKTFRDYVIDELFEPAGIRDFYFGTTDEAELNAAEFRLGPNEVKSKSGTACDPLDDLMRQPCIRRAALPGFNAIASAHGLASFYNAILTERYFSREMLKKVTRQGEAAKETPKASSFSTFSNGFALSGPADDMGRVFGHGGYGGSDALANRDLNLSIGFTSGILGPHPCKEKLYDLIGFTQREGWEA